MCRAHLVASVLAASIAACPLVLARTAQAAAGGWASHKGVPDRWEREVAAQWRTLERLLAQLHRDPAARRRWSQLEAEVFHRQSLLFPADRDPLDVVLRRTRALLDHLESMSGGPPRSRFDRQLQELSRRAARLPVADGGARRALFEQLLRLRRRIALSNPLLDFDRILFVKRHALPGRTELGNHMCDQFFGFHALPGGGLFVLEDAFGPDPHARNLLARSVCRNGRFAGRRLEPGAFLSPDLSYDAQHILFAFTEARPARYKWTRETTYHIFRVKVDGSELTQLTDGPFNDFDPCWLPDGRIVFISERRGGYGRCHPRPVPLYTLHAMNADGSGLVALSHHEANEWQPSVNGDGMIVYTRWDYVDRGNIQAHHPWITWPDGRDPRAIHGNFGRSKAARPLMEMDVRAIPGSRRYVATAAAHHSQAYGSLVIIDPDWLDDDAMGPLKRLTPEVPFPEAESPAHVGQVYATAWPLSEYFYLCVYDPSGSARRGPKNNYGIYLVDAFGNKELIYRDAAISCLSPIPLRPRARPPVVSGGLELAGQRPHRAATAGVVDVYNSRLPLPSGTPVKAIRIIQVLPKTTPLINQPRIGYGNEKGARAVLGTVPVEADGSAYFYLPAGRPVYFQLLDEQGLAVQSMRSATYVQPGGRLLCRGCHARRNTAPRAGTAVPLAFRRAPSPIEPEVEGSNPFSFPRLVQPVLDRHCVACHRRSGAIELAAGPWRSAPNGWYASYRNLQPYAFFYGRTEGTYDPWTAPRTIPGQFGARASKLYRLLRRGHYGVELSAAEWRRITLWLDCNSDFYGAYRQTDARAAGPSGG